MFEYLKGSILSSIHVLPRFYPFLCKILKKIVTFSSGCTLRSIDVNPGTPAIFDEGCCINPDRQRIGNSRAAHLNQNNY